MSVSDPFEEALKQTGIDFKRSTAEVAAYVRQRAAHLSELGAADPDFGKALAAEAKNCASYAAEAAVDRGDGADAKLFAVIIGGLSMAVA